MKAVNKLKRLIARSAERRRVLQSLAPGDYKPKAPHPLQQSRSLDGEDPKPPAQHLSAEGVHVEVIAGDTEKPSVVVALPRRMDSAVALEDSEGSDTGSSASRRPPKPVSDQKQDGNEAHTRGHAVSPLDEPLPFLSIGGGVGAGAATTPCDADAAYVVSESPTATDEHVYEEAFVKEVERLREKGKQVVLAEARLR